MKAKFAKTHALLKYHRQTPPDYLRTRETIRAIISNFTQIITQMYKSSLSIRREILIHLVFWLIWSYYSFLLRDEEGLRIGKVTLFYGTGIAVYVITFYCNYLFLLPWVFKPFRWKKALIGFITVIFLFTSLRYLIEEVITLSLWGIRNYTPGTSIIYYLYDNLLYSSKPVILSTVLWSIIFLVRTLEYNTYILQENKNTEIKFLKAQINPHFIFNTLNNIYSMVYFQSEKSLPAIEKLSGIMRFTTYESQKEKILLSEEINYIKAYVALEQLRHQDNAFVNLDIATEDESIEIPPYILSPLVENALKHGTASNATPIAVELKASNRQLAFTVANEISSQKKDKLGGIGLDNLKKRLEIHYPGSHKLHLINEHNRFIAQLEIDLK